MLTKGILVAVLLTAVNFGWAQNQYPSRAITLVIAFPPGGVTDIAGRIFADEMAAILKVPVIPDNRGGASGALGASIVLKSPRDGYTWLASTISGMVLSPTILKDVQYEADRDFVPISLISTMPDSLVVRPGSPYQTLDALIDAARKNPGKLSYATAGTGTDGHFNGEILAGSVHIRIKHVPFKGGGEIVSAVMGGHVDFGMGASANFLALERAGKLRTLAITGKTKLKAIPNVSTFENLGVQGNFIDNWAGCFVPAGTPKPVVDTLAAAAEKVVKSEKFMARIEKIGGLVQYIAPSDFQSMIRKDKNTAAEIAGRVAILQKRQ